MVGLHVAAHLNLIVLDERSDYGNKLEGPRPERFQWQADLGKYGLQDHKQKAFENRLKRVRFDIHDFNRVHVQSDGVLAGNRCDVFKVADCEHPELAAGYFLKGMSIVFGRTVIFSVIWSSTWRLWIDFQPATVQTQFHVKTCAKLPWTKAQLRWQR
jgi:hypothetical protein